MAKDIRAGRAFIELLLRDKVGGALLGVQRKLDGFARGVASVGGRVAIGAGLLGAPLAGAAQAYANYAGSVDDVVQRTGAAPRAVQTLGYAAQLTGAEFGDVEPALRKWQQNLSSAAAEAGPAREKFESLGLDAGRLANVGVDQQFEAIAEALSKLSDADRTAAAMELLGKSGTKLIPMLSGGAAGLSAFRKEAEHLGIVLSDEAIATGAELGDQMDRLRLVGSALAANIGAALAPSLVELGKVLVGTVGGVNQWIQAHPEMARGLALATVAAAGAAVGLFALAGAVKLAAFALGPLVLGANAAAAGWGVLTRATSLGQLAIGRAGSGMSTMANAARSATVAVWDLARAGGRATVAFAGNVYQAAVTHLRGVWTGARAAAGGLWNVARAATAAGIASAQAGAAAAIAGVASLASWQLLAGLLVAGGAAWFVYSGAAEQSLASVAYGAGYAGETLRGSFERTRPVVLGLVRSLGTTFAGVWAGIRDALAAGDLGAAASVAFAGLKLAGIQTLAALEQIFGESISGIARLLAAGQWSAAMQLVGAELNLVWQDTTASLGSVWQEFWTGAMIALDAAATGMRNAWSDVIAWLSKMLLTVWQAIDTAYKRVATMLGAKSAGSGIDFSAARKAIDDDNARANRERDKASADRAAARGAELTRKQAELDEERRRVAEMRQTLRAGAAAQAGPIDDALKRAQADLDKAREDAAAKRKSLETPPGGQQQEDAASATVARGDRVTQTFSAAAAVLLGAGGGPEKKIEANTARTARAVETIAGWGPPLSPTFL